MDNNQHHSETRQRPQKGQDFQGPLSTQGLPAPPSSNSNDLRLSILARIDRYRELYDAHVQRSQTVAGSGGQEGTQAGFDPRAIQFDIVQKALLNDIQSLLGFTQELESLVSAKRERKWLVHTSLALFNHWLHGVGIPSLVTYVSHTWPRLWNRLASAMDPSGRMSPLFYLLQWSGYPIACYKIFTSERQVTATTLLRKELKALEAGVEACLDVRSPACLEREAWDKIPWNYLRQ